MEQVKAPPRQEQRLKMSYEEFLTWSDEDVHAEWVNGEVIVFMPPKTRHQDVTTFLVTLLRLFAQFFRLGQVLTAPFEMKPTPESNAREPDILFVAQENLSLLTENKLEGPADLIVEIVSDDSVSRDRGDKFYEYQAAGVREYWIIDPRPGKERADFWVLDEDGRYRPVPLDEDGVYHSTVLSGFRLRPDWLWSEELPDPLRVFGNIVNFPSEMMEQLQTIADRGPE